MILGFVFDKILEIVNDVILLVVQDSSCPVSSSLELGFLKQH